jgi:hypothetical protein
MHIRKHHGLMEHAVVDLGPTDEVHFQQHGSGFRDTV